MLTLEAGRVVRRFIHKNTHALCSLRDHGNWKNREINNNAASNRAWLIYNYCEARLVIFTINGAWLVDQRAAVVVGLWAVMAERSPLIVTRTRSPSSSSYSSSSPLVRSVNDKVRMEKTYGAQL